MERPRNFATIFLWSMLVLQSLLMGLMLCFFYSLVREGIETTFQQSLDIAAGNTGAAANEKRQQLQAALDNLAADNSLRVSLRLDMEPRIREILEDEATSSVKEGEIYLRAAKGAYYPAPPEALLPTLEHLRTQAHLLESGRPHVIRVENGFLAVFHQNILLKEGRELGELFLVQNLSRALTTGEQAKPPAPDAPAPILTVDYNQEYYNLNTCQPVNMNTQQFAQDYATRPVKNQYGLRLFYALPRWTLWRQSGNLLLRFGIYGLLALGATAILSLLIIRKHSMALQGLVNNAAQLADSAGDAELTFPGGGFREFQELADSFNAVLKRLRSSRDEVRALNSELEARVTRRTRELTAANAQLTISEQQLKQLVEHIPVATCMFDTQMRPVYSSLMWNELFRLAVPNNAERDFLELIPEYRDYWEKAFNDCLKGKIRHCSEKRMMIHGREYWLRWEAHPWASNAIEPKDTDMLRVRQNDSTRFISTSRDPRVGGVIIFLEDISSQKWSQDALKRSADEAGTANRLKSEFLANVSHEIRTPLNCIIGFAEIISTNGRLEEIHKHAELILSESDALLVLINDLLDFSKIEAGKLDTESHDFDLQKLFHELTPGVRLRLRKKPVEFTAEIGPEVPRYLNGDSFRLRQIIMNLVHNAVKFTEKGSIRLSATLNAPLPGAYKLMFSVEDTGIGIPYDQQKNIFEKFTQADGSTTRRYGGTGLGTAISKKLVEIMGGAIGLKSVPGKGSTFWFTLPFPPGEEPEDDIAEGSTTGATALPALPILVAEDYLPNQMVARTHLESEGFQVEIANNGREACQCVEKNSYSLVLMDLSMPEMDGFEATAEIRKLLRGKEVPIVALTASAEPSVRTRCLNAQFDDIIAKPIRKADLIATVRKWLEHANRNAQPDRSETVVSSAGAQEREDSARVSGQQPVPVHAPEAPPSSGAAVPVAAGDDPVDFAALEEDYPGKQILIRRLLLHFTSLVQEQIDNLSNGIRERNVLLVRNESHKLIGGAGTLRINGICESARIINNAVKDGDFSVCEQALEHIIRQKAALERILKERFPEGTE